MVKKIIIILILFPFIVSAQDEEEKKLDITTEVQSGIRIESLTKKGSPKKVIYREKVFDYFIEPFYQKNYFNIQPDIQIISDVNFYDKYQVHTELGFSCFLNNYMVYSEKARSVNYEFEDYSWHPLFLQDRYLGSYMVKFETLNDDEELNTAVTIGKINPEFTPMTYKKADKGIIWEIYDEETRLILTGSQLRNFNNVNKYLFASRIETDKLGTGTLGFNFVNSWYKFDKDSSLSESEYYNGRESGGAAVYLKVKDAAPWDKNGARLRNMKIEVKYNGNNDYVKLDEFTAGSEKEKKYIFDMYGSSGFKDDYRYSDMDGYFIYRIILPQNIKSIRVTSIIAGDYSIEYSFDNKEYSLLSSNESKEDINNYKITAGDINLIEPVTGSTYVYLEISDDTPDDGYGGDMYKVEYYEDGELKVSFAPSDSKDSDESKYLYKDFYSTYRLDAGESHRFADGSGYFVYRFSVAPGTKNVKFRMLLKSDFKVKAYMEGFEDDANVLHSAGKNEDGLNRGYYELTLESYENIYNNSYISKSQRVLGIDYKVKIFDINFYLELNKLIDERIYANKDIKKKDQYAFLARGERAFKKQNIKINSKYYRIDPDYNLKDFVEDNDDQDEYADSLEPFHVKRDYKNYDPNLDVYNYNKNFIEVYDDKPDYTYQWNINDISCFSYDQEGFDVMLEKSKLFDVFSTSMSYFKVNQISDDKKSDKIVYKLNYQGPVPVNSSFNNEYRFEYIKDNRELSKNPHNLKNYFKFLYIYWGLKNVTWQFGLSQLYFDKDKLNDNAKLTSEFLNSLNYRIKISKDFTIIPAYMVKFYRFFQYSPDYYLFSDLTQHFLGGDINYKFLSSFTPYYYYRVIFTDDKINPGENNFLHIMELGITHTGEVFFKTGCNYTFQAFVEDKNRSREWNTFRIFTETRYYF